MGNQCCHDSDSSEYPKPTPNCIPPRISPPMRASTSPSRIAFYGNHSPRIRLYSFLLGTADLNSPVYRLRGIEGLLECIAVYIRRDNAVFNAWWTLPKEYWPAETLDWCDQTDFRRVTICDRYRLTSGPLFAWKLRVRLNPDPPAFMGLSECSFWRWTKEEGYATQLEQHYGSGGTKKLGELKEMVCSHWGIPPCLQVISTRPGPTCVESEFRDGTFQSWTNPGEKVQVFQGEHLSEKGLEYPLVYLSIRRTGCGSCGVCMNLLSKNVSCRSSNIPTP